MSSYYGQLFPEFWDGKTGRDLQRLGGKDACIVAAFLFSNRRSNMIGLYRIPVEDIRNNTPVKGAEAVARALSVLDQVKFAHYDAVTEFVWVREMARIRVGLRNRSESLSKGDTKVVAVNRLYQQVDDNPFLGAFYDRYHTTLHLNRQRTSEHNPKMTPLEWGIGALGKPVNRIREQSTDNSNRDQRTEQGRSAPRKPRRDQRTAPTAKSVRQSVLTKLVHTILDEHPGWSDSEVRDEAKARAGRAHIPYDGAVVGKALDAAVAQRGANA